MVTNTILKDQLTEPMIEVGAELLRKLDETGAEIPLALWLFLADSNEWKLYFWSPMVAVNGPIELYRLIQKALDEMGDQASAIPFSAISVMSSNDGLARAFREAVLTSRGVSRLRKAKTVVSGRIIDDSLVYRSLPDIHASLSALDRSIAELERSKREAGDTDLSWLDEARTAQKAARARFADRDDDGAQRAIRYANQCIGYGEGEVANLKRKEQLIRAAVEAALSGKPESVVAPK